MPLSQTEVTFARHALGRWRRGSGHFDIPYRNRGIAGGIAVLGPADDLHWACRRRRVTLPGFGKQDELRRQRGCRGDLEEDEGEGEIADHGAQNAPAGNWFQRYRVSLDGAHRLHREPG